MGFRNLLQQNQLLFSFHFGMTFWKYSHIPRFASLFDLLWMLQLLGASGYKYFFENLLFALEGGSWMRSCWLTCEPQL